MKNKQRNKTSNEHGTSLVEFAIVLPLLLIVLFGIFEFGLLLYNQAVITNASREGARFGIVARTPRHTDEDITNYVTSFCDQNLLKFFGDWAEPTITSSYSEGQNFGDPLTVQVQWPHRFLVLPNLTSGELTNSTTLSAYTVMNYE